MQSREALREEARRLSETNRRLMDKLIEALDTPTSTTEVRKRDDENNNQSKVILRRGTSYPF